MGFETQIISINFQIPTYNKAVPMGFETCFVAHHLF